MLNDTLAEIEHRIGAAKVVRAGARLESACVDYFARWQGHADAIVYPISTADVANCLSICHAIGCPVTVQGGKTGLVAGSVPPRDGHGIILNLSELNDIQHIDVSNRSVVAGVGVTLLDLNNALDEKGLQFPISIGSEGECQIGGIISTNAGGHGVFRYGSTRHQVLGLEFVLSDGRIVSNLSGLRKDNVGYDLAQLLCGSEGTLGVVTAAALKVLPKARHCTTALLSVGSIDEVIALYASLSTELSDFLSAFELIPAVGRMLVEKYVVDASPPAVHPSDWYVLLQAESTVKQIDLDSIVEEALAPFMERAIIKDAVLAQNVAQREQLWKFREGLVFAQSRHGVVLPHDMSVRVSSIPDLLRRGIAAVSDIVPDALFVTFGHVGDGNLHFSVVDNTGNPDFQQQYGAKVETAMCEVARSLGGSVSAEHGIGQKKVGLVSYTRSEEYQSVAKGIRSSMDPKRILNRTVLW